MQAARTYLMAKLEKAVIVIFFVGIVLILSGQSIYNYANRTINDLEAQLSPSLSQNEYWRIEGSLKWWRNALVSTYAPISLYLQEAGIAVLTSLTVYCVLGPLRNPKKNTAENNVSQAIDQIEQNPEQLDPINEESDSASE